MYKICFILLILFILSCDLMEPHPSVPPDELLSAPEKILIDNREFILETYMWRDFQPVSPPDGKPLIAIVWITAVDSLAIPAELDATRLWIIKDREVWETPFSDEDRGHVPDHKLEKVARNGPKWGPNITVDVVVRVVDKRNGRQYLLRASEQYIGMTV
jgi:hypothetical protein